MKAVAEWFPDREKSVAVGYFNAGTSLGAAIAPPLVVFLSMRFGWQAAFMATGALGFVWAALWYAQYRSPADHPRITPQERALIRDGRRCRPCRSAAFATSSPRGAWAIALPRFFAGAWQTFSFWIPLYLATERHMELKQIAIFAWMPFSRPTSAASRAATCRRISRNGSSCRSCGRALPASRSARC